MMKHLRHTLYIALTTILSFGATSCEDKGVIPDSALVNIFYDAMLTNAYIQEMGIDYDSLDIYEPILKRYGYTIHDMRHTISTISQRKSARLSDLMAAASDRLEIEAEREKHIIRVLDTIDNVARRSFTRDIYSDTLIEARRLKDSTRLFVRIDSLVPGEYTVTFDYMIDTLDENRNSRVEAYILRHDSTHVLRHTTMLTRYRESSYTRKFTTDTSHYALCINMFYHPRSEEAEKPSIKISNFNIRRVLPTSVSVDSLYEQQLNIRLFNHRLMMSFTADTVRPVVEPIIEQDSTLNHEPQDSLALCTD